MSGLLDALWPSGDLVVIIGSQDLTIGNGHPRLAERFQNEVTGVAAGGFRIAGAVLTLMVRGLAAGSRQAVVEVNDRPVGLFRHYPGATPEHWFPEALSVGAEVLRAGGE